MTVDYYNSGKLIYPLLMQVLKISEKYQPEEYWNEVAEFISRRKGSQVVAGDDEPYYRYKRSLFLRLFDTIDFEGKRVLEIGSGPGGNLEYLLQKGCRQIAGDVQGIEQGHYNL